MKRNFILLITLFVISTSAMAQEAQFSNFTKLCMHELNLKEVSAQGRTENLPAFSQELEEKYGLYKTETGYQVGALASVDLENIDEKTLTDVGIKIGSKIKDTWTMEIPLYVLPNVANIKGLRYIEINVPVKKNLDVVRTETLVSSVHTGTGLKSPYTGKGIVVGIIDGGFDYTHPTFTGRINRVLETHKNNRELIGANAILNAKHDSNPDGTHNGSHGTHVASIAAGSGSILSEYRGIAPEAEIVLVAWRNVVNTAAAVDYIFKYAKSVGKPCVINMSYGGHGDNPHDGTSETDKALKNLVGNGNILVAAAGNEGDSKLHFYHNFRTNPDSYVATIANFSPNEIVKQKGKGRIEIWGSANSSFQVNVFAVDAQGRLLGQTNFVASNDLLSPTNTKTISTSQGNINITFALTRSHINNSKPNITLDIDNPTENYVGILLTSSNSEVHAWNASRGDFIKMSSLSLSIGNKPVEIREGDTNYTIGGEGANSDAVISVGSYTTKPTWKRLSDQKEVNYGGNFGEIAPSSSRGPTVDGRTKPDITAPGRYIVAAVNSFDTDYTPTGKNGDFVVNGLTSTTTGQKWQFAAMQGTSMAAPVVTGIIALMLEANPTLNTEQIRAVLRNQGRKVDNFTGTIPSTGSNTWGWGKINALESVKQAEQIPRLIAQINNNNSPTTFCAGGSVTFFANTGTGLSYQWQKNGVNIAGATSTSFRATETGSYQVIVSQGTTSLTSNAIIVTVNPAPSRPTLSVSKTIFCQGEDIVLNATATGATQYVWNINGVNQTTTGNAYTLRTANSSIGNYTARVLAKNVSCESENSASVTWTLNALPPTPTFQVTRSSGDANPTLVSSSSVGNQWYLNNNPIQGATGQTHRAVESGNYGLKVTINGCSADALPNIVTRAEEQEITNYVSLYPNPAHDKLIVSFSKSLPNSKITVYSPEGKTLFSENLTNPESNFPINIREWEQGLYLLTIQTEKGTIVKKFTKQ